LGRTEADRKDYERAVVVEAEVNETNKTTLRSERIGALKKRKKVTRKFKKTRKKDLTGPTLLEMSDNAGGLNGSTQHSARSHLALKTKAKIAR
jgi:hypothetical protein